MQEDLPPELVREYIDASLDKLTRMDECLRCLDESGRETFLSLAHKLKGTGGVYGLAVVSDIATRLDDAVRLVRDGELTLTPALLEALSLGVTVLREVFEQASSGSVTLTADHRFFGEMDRVARPGPG